MSSEKDTSNLVAKYAQLTFISADGKTHICAVQKFNKEKDTFEEMPGSPDGSQQQELSIKLTLIAANWEEKGYKTISYISSVPTDDGGKHISQRLCVYEKDTQPPSKEIAFEGDEVQGKSAS